MMAFRRHNCQTMSVDDEKGTEFLRWSLWCWQEHRSGGSGGWGARWAKWVVICIQREHGILAIWWNIFKTNTWNEGSQGETKDDAKCLLLTAPMLSSCHIAVVGNLYKPPWPYSPDAFVAVARRWSSLEVFLQPFVMVCRAVVAEEVCGNVK